MKIGDRVQMKRNRAKKGVIISFAEQDLRSNKGHLLEGKGDARVSIDGTKGHEAIPRTMLAVIEGQLKNTLLLMKQSIKNGSIRQYFDITKKIMS